MRHISRLIKLVSEERPTPCLDGQVEGQEVKVHFDHRGKFNVITSAAVELIEANVRTKSNLLLSRLPVSGIVTS